MRSRPYNSEIEWSEGSALKRNFTVTSLRQGFEILLIIIALVFLTLVYRKFIFGGVSIIADPDTFIEADPRIVFLNRVGQIAFMILLTSIAVLRGISIYKFKRVLLFWSPLLAYLYISIFWNHDPDVISRTIKFTAIIFTICIYLSSPKSAENFYLAALIFVVGSIVCGWLMWSLGYNSVYMSNGYGSTYTGLPSHKGHLSIFSVIGCAIAFAAIHKEKTSLVKVTLLVICIFSLIQSKTLTNQIGLIIAVFGLRYFTFSAVGVAAFGVLLPLIFSVFGGLFELLGKDITLTGRTLLWDFSIRSSMDMWLIGHGFEHTSSIDDWAALLRRQFRNDSFFIPHAHNLWVESFYKFGLLGTLIMFVTLALQPAFKNRYQNTDFAHTASKIILLILLFASSANVPFLNTGLSGVIFIFAATHLMLQQQARLPRPTKQNS